MAMHNFDHLSVEDGRRGAFRQNLKEVCPKNISPLVLNLVL